MKIFYEQRKILPLSCFITVFFITFNCIYLYMHKADNEELYKNLSSYSAFAKKNGTEVTEEFKQAYYDYMFKKDNSFSGVYKSVTGKELRSDCFKELEEDYIKLTEGAYSIEDKYTLQLIQHYGDRIVYFRNYIESPETMYLQALDQDLPEETKGRIKEVLASKEYNYFFPSESSTSFISHLFRDVWKTLLIEFFIQAGLYTGFLVNYERETKKNTTDCLYSTRTGRSIVVYKGIASVISYLLSISVILLVTLHFHKFITDYSVFMDTSVNNAFLGVSKPLSIFLTGSKMTLAQLLSSYVTYTYGIALLFILSFFAVFLHIRNTLAGISCVSVITLLVFHRNILTSAPLGWFEVNKGIRQFIYFENNEWMMLAICMITVLSMLYMSYRIYLRKDA